MSATKLNQLQLVQQNLQHLLFQKQQLELQITELDSAMTELSMTDKAYKIVGRIMIAATKSTLEEDLRQKKEIADLRLRNFLQQEEKLKKNLEELQQEVVQELKNDKK